MTAMHQVIQCVRDAGVAAGLAEYQVKKLELVIEELFTNSATHAVREKALAAGTHADDTKLSVWIEAIPCERGLDIHYEDDGPAFDPTDIEADAAQHALANARIGGLGRVLITSTPTAISYRRENGRNHVSLHFGQ